MDQKELNDVIDFLNQAYIKAMFNMGMSDDEVAGVLLESVRLMEELLFEDMVENYHEESN